ncbi:MAG: AbrB family transcriptional regulator [Selenomonadaceae bacterium]|nr:AbrB family transcriptional regulator [Selenomonadaceae bacterium]
MIASGSRMAIFLSKTYGFSLITAFLAMAPGGITEMCVAGLAMGANVPLILAYQLFRLLTINFASPFVINWYFKRNEEEKT